MHPEDRVRRGMPRLEQSVQVRLGQNHEKVGLLATVVEQRASV
jgi:hypothetical protein